MAGRFRAGPGALPRAPRHRGGGARQHRHSLRGRTGRCGGHQGCRLRPHAKGPALLEAASRAVRSTRVRIRVQARARGARLTKPAGGPLQMLPGATSGEEAERNAAVAVLPVGSFEQHGAHLPLATDALVACAIADAVATKYNLFLLPAITLSCSHEHS